MHVYLLHNIVSVLGLPLSLDSLGGLGVLLAFSCYRELGHGGIVKQVHTESSRRTEGLSQNFVGLVR